MDLEKYKVLFLDHLEKNNLSLKDETWRHGRFVDKDARYLYSLFCLTLEHLEKKDETPYNMYPEYDASVSYLEGDVVSFGGEPCVLFRNVHINNQLIWTPIGKPPFGYK